MATQLRIPGTEQLCETGDLEHPRCPIAIGEFLVGDDFVWLCQACFNVLWPNGNPSGITWDTDEYLGPIPDGPVM